MRFSIIVPVYNVENYLKKCLDSITSQGFDDYEVIIVDDETQDNSILIAQAYVDKFPDKFQIIHQKNKGLGGARNTGVNAAKGEYLVFLDSDDYIHEHMLEVLDQCIRDNPCEMVIFNYYLASISGKTLSNAVFFQRDELVTGIEKKKELLQQPPAAWNKVYLRSFFIQSGVTFPEKTLYEDGVTRILLAKAERIMLCAKSLYYYVQRPGSIMNSKISPRVLEIEKVVNLVREKFICEGLYEEYKDSVDAALIGSVICVIDGINQKNRTHAYQEMLLQFILEQFPDHLTNTELLPEVRRKLAWLLHRGGHAYYLRFSVLPRINFVRRLKWALLQIPAVNKLNSLRKQKRNEG